MADKAAIRAELEQTRSAFHALAARISDADWERKSSVPEWTVGQLMFHITSYLTMIVPWGVDGALKGKKVSGMQPWMAHSFVGDWANSLGMRWFARRERSSTILRTYDAAHVNVLAVLDRMTDADWPKTTYILGKVITVEDVFHSHTMHFREHGPHIESVLGSLPRL